MNWPSRLAAVAVVPILLGEGFGISNRGFPVSVRHDNHQHQQLGYQEVRNSGGVVALFHRSRNSALDDKDDEATLPPLPDWAVSNVLVPPGDVNDDELEILYLGTDDFVSLELENDKTIPEFFCATVVYEDPDDDVRYHVEPRMGVIEPNGGICEVTVHPIFDEGDDTDAAPADLTPEEQILLKTPPSPAWLVISTEERQWHYKLDSSATDEL